MKRSRLINTLLALLILLATLYLAQMLWQLLSGYADLILLFLLGWLLAFILNPLVSQLSEHPAPTMPSPALPTAHGGAHTQRFADFRLSRGAAVIIVYVGLVLVIALAIALFVPTAIDQLSLLASRGPEYVAQIPSAAVWVQEQLEQRGVRLNVEEAVRSALGSLQGYASDMIKNALNIFTSLLSLLANIFIVLILGFYIAFEGPRLQQIIVNAIPAQYHDEVGFFTERVSRTFGGFIRGQLLQALLIGIGTAVAMTILGLDFVLVASLFAGLFMLIPLVGPFLGLIPPVLVVLAQSPGLAIWLLAALFIYQFVIVNVLMPRMMGEAVGLHPLLVFAALLISFKVAGFWGAFFCIPIAGVLWAMFVFFFGRWQKGEANSKSQHQNPK